MVSLGLLARSAFVFYNELGETGRYEEERKRGEHDEQDARQFMGYDTTPPDASSQRMTTAIL
jgi:hypothetical protein